MHDQPTCGPVLSPDELQAQHENDVLWHLFDAYPAVFTVDELVSELAPPGTETASRREGFVTAIQDLAARGLLHRHESFVWLSRSGKAAQVLVTVR